MISLLATMLLQAAAPAPPPPPPPPACKSGKPCRAKANLATLLSNDDYPKDALRNNEQGDVGFRLEVGADGLVKACTITAPSGSAALDSATCRLLTERARFAPARNKRGKAVPDSVAARIVWRIDEESRLMPRGSWRFTAKMRVSAAGEAICTYAVDPAPAETTPCPEEPSPDMILAARTLGREVSQTFVTTIKPQGAPEAGGLADHGEEVMIAEVALDLAPDGSIRQCRTLQTRSLGLAAGSPPPPSPCGHLTPGTRMFRPVTADDAVSTFLYTLRAFITR